MSESGIFLLAVLVTGVLSLPAWIASGNVVAGCLPILLSALALGSGGHHHMDDALDDARWGRVLPQGVRQGRFFTPQGTYLYGEYRGQFQVVAWDTLGESLPNEEHASEIVALHLAQRPGARRVLVFGPGSYGLCRRLLGLPQMEQVTWLDPDPDYPQRLLEILPEDMASRDARLHIPSLDLRRYLDLSSKTYDLILLNLPNVTTLAMNRFMTREFLNQLRGHLGSEGMLSVRVSGGDNAMGDERVNMGATMYRTLEAEFPNIVVKPGDETWLLATAGTVFDQAPAMLRDRFSAIPGAEAIYPAAAVPSLYPPDRIRFQREAYVRAVEADRAGLLLNTHRQPRSLLHSLLFAARESGVRQANTKRLRQVAEAGRAVLPFAMILYLVLRLVFRRTGRGSWAEEPFDLYVVVGGTGAVGMALNILLMFHYQSNHGSLFLHVGLVTALYMAGLALGGGGAAWWAANPGTELRRSVPLSIGFQVVLLAGIALADGKITEWAFMVLFLVSGFLGGVYVPLVAEALRAQGVADQRSGGALASSDCLGGAVGGMLTGLLLVPLFGTLYTLCVLGGLLILVGIPLVAPRRPEVLDSFESISRPVAYILFGIAAFCLGTSVQLARAGAPDLGRLLRDAAQAMAPERTFEFQEASQVLVTPDHSAYCFSSHGRGDGMGGYGGPIVLSILVDDQARLLDFRVIDSHETPSYLAMVLPWVQTLKESDLAELPADLDGVSGATLTSTAILDTLRQAGRQFAADTLHLGAFPVSRVGWSVDRRIPLMAGLILVAWGLRRSPSRRWRRIFLLGVVVTCGLYLNLQYSMAQVFPLLRFSLPPPGLNLAFLTIVGIPLLVLLVGNLYCGYLCPFGALQELVGDLLPRRIRLDPDLAVWRYTRQFKYLLLFVLVMMLAGTLSLDPAPIDPLVNVFNRHQPSPVGVLVLSVIGLSVVYRRFWCRNLCPVGAFLSLLNGVQLLRRFLPALSYRACTFGLTGKRELDCLTCDRCRHVRACDRRALQPPPLRTARRRNVLFVALVVLCGLFVLQRSVITWRTASVLPGIAAYSSAGTPREVDMRRVRWLMDQRRLSDHTARYADPVE